MRSPRADLMAAAAAWLVVVATGVVCAWPLLAGGGWFTYQDNPCHLAALADLAAGSGGWTDAAMLGQPYAATHGPLWYPLLGRLVALGVPAGLLVALFDLAGFLAPALAVLLVARRRAPWPAATLAAWLVLVQRPWLAGFESPLGGMAPFGLAAALLVLIIGDLAERELSARRLARLAVWYGLLGLTHLFLLLPSVLAFALWAAMRLREPGAALDVPRRLAAAALGALLSAPYWLPALLDRAHLVIRDVPLSAPLGLLYLVAPVDPLDLADGRVTWLKSLGFTDVLPMAALVVLGVLGVRRWRHDPAARLALLTAATLLVLVLVVIPATGEPLAGPHSWRRLMLVRIVLGLAAGSALAAWTGTAIPATRPVINIIVGVLMVLSALWWQRPLADATPAPDHPEVAQLREVWRRLAAGADAASRGRVYVQDTFYLDGDDRGLFHSHLPALTARETGVSQVGAWYGGMPHPTEDWTTSQFGLMFGAPLRDTDALVRMQRLAPAAAVDRLLIANPQLARKLVGTGLFRLESTVGRYQVLTSTQGRPVWATGDSGAAVDVTVRRPGHWQLRAAATRPGWSSTLSLAWAPGWRLTGPAGAAVERASDGRLQVTGLPAGDRTIILDYQPRRWPWLLTLAGVMAAALMAADRPRGMWAGGHAGAVSPRTQDA
jgi:hypothetical protein